MIGAVTTGFAATHATASVTRLTPASSASLRSSSTVPNSRSCQYRSWYMPPALPRVNRPAGGAADPEYLPDSSPPAIGLYGMTPTPSSPQNGSISRSIWRNSRL